MISSVGSNNSTGKFYNAEKHTQILIALLKAHGIRKVIASPGSTNVCLVGSLQSDPFFEIYSAVDERSAAFMAVGMAAESGEAVALSCTGSTASRNYIPGLTEAYYRKLPVLAITSSQHLGRVGQYYNQVIDRSSPLADMVMESVTVDCVFTREDEWACALNINKALIALTKNGGGPAHINLVTTYNDDFSCKKLPSVKMIQYSDGRKMLPSLSSFKHIAILVGVHRRWSEELADAVEAFCEAYNAVVIANHASNYKGKYGYNPNLVNNMVQYSPKAEKADLVIYIGSISRYPSKMNEREMWRVNPDGEIRDMEKKLTRVFAMEEVDFFRSYTNQHTKKKNTGYAKQWQSEYQTVLDKLPELPYSNVWIAKNMSQMLPEGSVFHLSGSNTARSWNFFQIPLGVECYSNDGTMGIDGQISSLVGESLVDPKRLHFGASGDLTFFYDMGTIGNRHIKSNLRLMIVNNGLGVEFKNHSCNSSKFGEAADRYMAAAGHFGNKSPDLIRHYAEDLGYEYLSASTKEEFLEKAVRFTTPELTERPMIFEVFTESEKDAEAIYIMNHYVSNIQGGAKEHAKKIIKSVLSERTIATVSHLIKK